jgi:hypothetical protein
MPIAALGILRECLVQDLPARKKNNRFKLISGIIAILFLTMVILAFYPRYYFEIKNLSNGREILKCSASPGDNIWIVFVNSVEKLPVADHFVLDEDLQILFTETIYQAPYAGYVQEERAENIGPYTMRISNLDKPMERVTFFAGYNSRHMVFLNGSWIPIYEKARGGDLIEIRVKVTCLFSLMTGR